LEIQRNKKIYRKTRKVLTVYKRHHPKAYIHRPYVKKERKRRRRKRSRRLVTNSSAM